MKCIAFEVFLSAQLAHEHQIFISAQLARDPKKDQTIMNIRSMVIKVNTSKGKHLITRLYVKFKTASERLFNC